VVSATVQNLGKDICTSLKVHSISFVILSYDALYSGYRLNCKIKYKNKVIKLRKEIFFLSLSLLRIAI
jgi:hypothetical protein